MRPAHRSGAVLQVLSVPWFSLRYLCVLNTLGLLCPWLTDSPTTSWPYPQGSRSRKSILPSSCTYLFIILFKLNLEVPVHDFNEAEGKLVVG